jgi:ribosomal protein L3 glutamine methyltransferase
MQDETVADLINWAERNMAAAGVVCAQGTGSCRDEAAAIIYHLLDLEHADPAAYGRRVTADDRRRCEAAVRRRIEERVPAAYLLGETRFAGLRFSVDPRVLIPRSPFAELIAMHFEPWLTSSRPLRILDLGTGSGCIAIACALTFPDSLVLATDISADALAVARLNVRRHGLDDRVQLLLADLFSGLAGRFDLIVSNPPYVPEADLRDMPPEFAREPRSALAGGPDGLDLVRRIVTGAGKYLCSDGFLAVEVGGGKRALEAAFPRIPFVWPELANGGDGIALVAAGDLPSENDGIGRPARGH